MKRVEIKSLLKESGISVSVSRITSVAKGLEFGGPDYSDSEVDQIIRTLTESPRTDDRTGVRVGLSESEMSESENAKSGSELALAGQLQTVSAGIGNQFQKIDSALSMVEQTAGLQIANRIADIPSNVIAQAQVALTNKLVNSADIADTVLGSFNFTELGGMALQNFTPVGSLPESVY